MNKKILITHETIQKRVSELAKEISRDFQDKDPVLICILNGAVFFYADLIMKMTIPIKMDFIRVSSYGSGIASSGLVKMVKDIELPIEGKNVILVEDIVDTGLTLKNIVEQIAGKKPASVRICALIDKAERREQRIQLDYCGFHVPEGFLVGYGLDHDENYRSLPDIYKLS